MIICFYRSSSCIYYSPWHIYLLNDIFLLLFLFLPLTTYQYLLIIIILFLFSLNMLTMLIQAGADKKWCISIHVFQIFHIFQYIYFYNSRMHQQVTCQFGHTNLDNHLNYSFEIHCKFICMLVINSCIIFHIQTTVKFFFIRYWYFMKSFPAVNLFIWINNFS